jgi:hypothetical protein
VDSNANLSCQTVARPLLIQTTSSVAVVDLNACDVLFTLFPHSICYLYRPQHVPSPLSLSLSLSIRSVARSICYCTFDQLRRLIGPHLDRFSIDDILANATQSQLFVKTVNLLLDNAHGCATRPLVIGQPVSM